MRTIQTSFDQKNTRRAIRCAYRSFARRHARWADSLFDEYFLTDRATHLLGDPGSVDPWALADAWSRQFHAWDEASREHAIASVVPVAADFLAFYRAELEAQNTLSRHPSGLFGWRKRFDTSAHVGSKLGECR
ncbi:MAG: hypothetical protein JSV66_06000 [Trueperaceae bacterium]|nr:MAG: hypothetical protein JSV66_06000 [Trueperaceae bacterium]